MNAIDVMIASPSDVAAERRIVREVIHEWNATHSTEHGIVLIPIDWESNSHPEYGREPQSVLNAQILEGADILIAIFWTRLGTPTAESRSGTIEEINRHTAKNKGAMLYFSGRPIPQELAMGGELEDVDDYKKGIQKNCLYGTFKTRVKFKELVRRHLTKELQKPRYRTGPIAPSGTKPNIDTDPSASALLMAAAQTDDGQIFHIVLNEGASVRVGQTEFMQKQHPREQARWEAALEVLEKQHLIVPLSTARESFELTENGWTFGDALLSKQPNEAVWSITGSGFDQKLQIAFSKQTKVRAIQYALATGAIMASVEATRSPGKSEYNLDQSKLGEMMSISGLGPMLLLLDCECSGQSQTFDLQVNLSQAFVQKDHSTHVVGQLRGEGRVKR